MPDTTGANKDNKWITKCPDPSAVASNTLSHLCSAPLTVLPRHGRLSLGLDGFRGRRWRVITENENRAVQLQDSRGTASSSGDQLQYSPFVRYVEVATTQLPSTNTGLEMLDEQHINLDAEYQRGSSPVNMFTEFALSWADRCCVAAYEANWCVFDLSCVSKSSQIDYS